MTKKSLGVETVADKQMLSSHPTRKAGELLALLEDSRRLAAQPVTNGHALSNLPLQDAAEELAMDSMALVAQNVPKKFALSEHTHREPGSGPAPEPTGMTLMHPERTVMQA